MKIRLFLLIAFLVFLVGYTIDYARERRYCHEILTSGACEQVDPYLGGDEGSLRAWCKACRR
jgi:hypothetical protein